MHMCVYMHVYICKDVNNMNHRCVVLLCVGNEHEWLCRLEHAVTASQRSDVAVRVPEGVLGVAVRVRISDYGIRVRLPGLFEN